MTNDQLDELHFSHLSVVSKHDSPTSPPVNHSLRAKVTRNPAYLAVYPLKHNTLALYFTNRVASLARYAALLGKVKVRTSPEAQEAEKQPKRSSS